MSIQESSSAAEALAAVAQAIEHSTAFSLIVLDRVLPNTQGFEALQGIRRLDPHVPVIISSSDNLSGDLTEARAQGAAVYLMKPVRRAELLSALFEALSSAGAEGPGGGTLVHRPEKLRILVAEDSEDNRFLLQAYLAEQPYELTFAYNGQEAVEAFQPGRFDMILMDIQMPIMDGLTATSTIRELEREQSLPPIAILALTANALIEDAQRSLEAGCTAHLAKPISQEKLIGAIENFRYGSGSGAARAEAEALSQS
jgi:CheY-like chemotaxis protein